MDDPESITTVLTGDEAPVTTGPLTGVPAFELQDVDASNGEPAVNAGVATARRGEDTVEPPSPVDQTADSGPTTSPLEPGDVYLTRGQIFDAGIIHTVSPLEPGDVYLAPGQIFDLDAPRGGKQRDRGPKGPTPPPTPERVAALEAEVEAAAHKTYVMGRVRRALGVVTDDQLAERLRVLETTIQAQIDERKAVKESIIQRADELKESTHWKAAGDQFKALFDEWKAVGAAGRELDDELWARFQGARETFNRRRSAYFDERQVVWAAHRETKEALCARVEAINESTDWRATADAIKAIQAEWKAIGSAGRDADDALWARFNSAKQLFFDRRAAAWAEARKLKEGLIAEAEMHKDSTDWRLAAEAMKALQARWKEAGTSGPASEDELWQRFRAATQAFFDHRSATFEAREPRAEARTDRAGGIALLLHRYAHRFSRRQGPPGRMENDWSRAAGTVGSAVESIPRCVRQDFRRRLGRTRAPPDRVANPHEGSDDPQAGSAQFATRIDHPRRGQHRAVAGNAFDLASRWQIRGNRGESGRQNPGRRRTHPAKTGTSRGAACLHRRYGVQDSRTVNRRLSPCS